MGRRPDPRTRNAVEKLLCLGYSNHEIAGRLKRHVVTIEKVVSELYASLGINMNPQVSRRVTFALTYLGARGILDYEALKAMSRSEDPDASGEAEVG